MDLRKVEKGMDAYVECMEQIKLRHKFIQDFYELSGGRFYAPIVSETIALQFRLIFEMIVMASVVAHRPIWKELSQKLQSGRFRDVIRRLREVNPNFYPQPVKENREVEKLDPRHVADWKPLPDNEYLTEEKLIAEHEKIGKIVHARAPIKQLDPIKSLNVHAGLESKILKLLGMHTIQLIDSSSFALVQMNVNGKVTWTYWESIPET